MSLKEDLLKKAEQMAKECGQFILQWRKTNRGAIEPPMYIPQFAYTAGELRGVVLALFWAEIINHEDMDAIRRMAFPTFDGSELPPEMPSMLADFFSGKASEFLDELGKEGA